MRLVVPGLVGDADDDSAKAERTAAFVDAPPPGQPERRRRPRRVVPRELSARLRGYQSLAIERTLDGTVPELRLARDDNDAWQPRDVVLEIDWEDGIEDLVRLEHLLQGVTLHTNDDRRLRLDARGEDRWVLRAWGEGCALESVRVHRFDQARDDVGSLLVQMELDASEDTGLYRPHPAPGASSDRPQMALGPLHRAPWPDWREPTLLLVHGTAGSTELSFDPLASPRSWGRLQEAYGERILTFEHRTLSEDLLTSAINLLRVLPPDLTLDVLALSRGGMVMELLLHGPVDAARLDAVADQVEAADLDADGRPDQRAFHRSRFLRAFSEFNALWAEKRPRIRRLARAGCAIRGVPGLHKGWERYFGLLFASYRLLLDSEAQAVRTRMERGMSFLRALRLILTASAQQMGRHDYDSIGLPGMDAQRPDAPVMRLLNSADAQQRVFDSEVATIGGDFRGTGPATWALARIAAHIHEVRDLEPPDNAHDLVVPLASTRGGLRRRASHHHTLRGPAGHHFNYLWHGPTRAAIVRWLARPEGARIDTGFAEAMAQSPPLPRSRA